MASLPTAPPDRPDARDCAAEHRGGEPAPGSGLALLPTGNHTSRRGRSGRWQRAGCGRRGTETALFVAPDNGVLTYPLRCQPARRVISLGQAAERYFRHPVSATFHGRDLFAPIVAHLAAGLALDALLDTATAHTLLELPVVEPMAEQEAQGDPTLRLHVLDADRFGNLITNLTPRRWEQWQRTIGANAQTAAASVQVSVGETQWQGLARTFADVVAAARSPTGAARDAWRSPCATAARRNCSADALRPPADELGRTPCPAWRMREVRRSTGHTRQRLFDTRTAML